MFKKEITVITSLNIYTKNIDYTVFDKIADTDKKFSNLCKLISDKNIRIKIDNLLRLLYRFNKEDDNISFVLNEKKFLSVWMIVSFPEFILGKTKNQLVNPNNYHDDVYMISKSMIEKLTGLTDKFITNEQMRQFNKTLANIAML